MNILFLSEIDYPLGTVGMFLGGGGGSSLLSVLQQATLPSESIFCGSQF